MSLISIHDVMPETMPRVEQWLERLTGAGHERITLLIVPGRPWEPGHIERLASWQTAGIELAAHGWYHHAECIHGLYHRVHGALISRQAAEHLPLSAEEILVWMADASTWFVDRGLSAPSTYVPPAWALGKLPQRRLRLTPYSRVETTLGLIDTASGRLARLPLVGFEADHRLRALALRGWNRLQRAWAGRSGLPVRVAIHPWDGELLLRDDLLRLIHELPASRCYRDMAAQGAR